MSHVFKYMEHYFNGITWGLSSTENRILDHPDAEQVKDGSKRIYADEIQGLLVELLTDYYPLEGILSLPVKSPSLRLLDIG